MDKGVSRPEGDLRRSQITAAALILGLLFAVFGASGIFWLSLPESGTAVLTRDTYMRLDGRLFGYVSGSYSSQRDAEIRIIIFDQDNWYKRIRGEDFVKTVVDSIAHNGTETSFSANLPSSEAYYLYIFDANPDFGNGYGPTQVDCHWHIWGSSIDYSLIFFPLFWLGVAFILYSHYAGMRFTVRRKQEGI